LDSLPFAFLGEEVDQSLCFSFGVHQVKLPHRMAACKHESIVDCSIEHLHCPWDGYRPHTSGRMVG
jgi:hypothetical protein